MFYELIYTRCRQGMDITQQGRQISGDGYKVYSCTPAIMEEGAVDLPLLANAAQAKQPYADPGFMDDAYLFYVPDTGANIFMNFHPIPFDANAQGDYSHRPGNFVNHALIGDFSKLYPYKMFQDDAVWNAKTKGEAYYYENPPADAGLPVRGGFDPPGQYRFEDISAFIADGRQEALKKAVAFLIAQYKEEPEKRKFLVIKDESSRNIELWIAAIECAFSPRIASFVSFATRMDKFINANRYTVKAGIYQQQMNLQDPHHKQRFRAMIVGLDERDKANISAARPLGSSPFVLLDGKQKQALFEADTSNPYYNIITKFDKEHKEFCGEFLQAFSVVTPGAEIYDLYGIFTALYKTALPDTRTLANALERLNKYKAEDAGVIREIYGRVNTEISRFMREDFSSALTIIDWLLTASNVAGDTGAKGHLTGIVCNAFADIIFGKTDNTAKRNYWKHIQSTGFAADAARIVTDAQKIKDNSSNLNTPADRAAFVSVYLDCASFLGSIDQQNLKSIVRFGIRICHQNNDTNTAHEIIQNLSLVKNINIQDFLLSLANDKDNEFNEFIIKYIISRDNAILASDNSVCSFCKKLSDGGLGRLAGTALAKRANILTKSSDMERFIESTGKTNFIGEDSLAKVFESIDAKISVSDVRLAELLQTRKPHSAKCINSAHLFALNILSGSRRKQSLKEELKDLRSQGFPTITTDKNYMDKLADCLIKAGLTDEEQWFIFDILSDAPNEYFSAYIYKLICAAKKNQGKWNALFKYASEKGNKQLNGCIVNALVESGQNEKSLLALSDLIKEEKSVRYFDDVADEVRDTISSQKGKSVKGKADK